MSIKPPIKCPPDYSILAFRFTECKKAGIVKGMSTQLAVDLQDFFVPVTNYEERKINLKAGETKKIDVSSIGERWPLQEEYEFVANADNCGDGSEHEYALYDANLNLIESITFTVDIDYPTFTLALRNAVQNSTIINTLVSIDANNFTGETGIINVKAINRGIKYRHIFTFDTTGFGNYLPFPFIHPGNLKVPYVKYERPKIKLMMIYPDYYKASVLSGCNCIDASGDMKSNKKWIEYAFEEDHYRINNPLTPIVISPNMTLPAGNEGFQWQLDSTDHIGYHFKVGDMITTAENTLVPIMRGFITEIQGYDVLVDTGIGTGSPNETAKHVWSPSTVTWRKMGDFYLHTTAQDVNDTDNLFIDTLYIRNPHNYDLPIKIVLAS